MYTAQRETFNPETLLVDLEKAGLALRALEDLSQFRTNSKIHQDTGGPAITSCMELLIQQINAEEKLLEEHTRPRLLDFMNLESGNIYKGKRIYGNPTDSFSQIITCLTHDHPDKLRSIQQAVRKGARNRKILSHDRNALFSNKTEVWAQKKSVDLGNGLYLDKNNDNDRKRELLRSAVEAAGLKWGKDVVISW